MTNNTVRAARAPFAITNIEERTASVYRIVRALIDAAPLPRDLYYFLDLALWRLTEFEKSDSHKYGIRYRTPDVLGPDTHIIQHEHVVPKKWLVDHIIARPDDAESYLALAAACIVSVEEHDRLRYAPGFGWERYIATGITPLDTADGMKPLDLVAAAAAHRAVLADLGENDLPAAPNG